jgi:ABC transporter, phosphonate, periplasmic substrate-binding protein
MGPDGEGWWADALRLSSNRDLLIPSSILFMGGQVCANGGTVPFGVEPYDTAARSVPIYQKVGELIGDKLGCKVEVFVATSYNADIEATRNGKLEIGEFGPLGYVLAHQVPSRGSRRLWHRRRQTRHLLGQHRHLPRIRYRHRRPDQRA